MKKYIYYVLTLFILISCETGGDTEVNIDKVIDSLSFNKEYYENGELRLFEEFNNFTGNGVCLEYYSNGNIKREGKYKNFKPSGFWSNYTEAGTLEFKKETIWLDTNVQYLNQIIFYDKNGSINTERSSFYNIEVEKNEKVYLGDSIKVFIELGNSINKYGLEIRLGELTENNQWKDSSSVDTVYYGKYDVTVPMAIITNKLGKQFIQGQIVDYKVNEIESRFLVQERIMYFSIEYFVEEKEKG